MNYPITIEIPRCVVDDLETQSANATEGVAADQGGWRFSRMICAILETRKGQEFTITTEEQAQAVFDSASHRRERAATPSLRRSLKALGFTPEVD